MTHMLAMVSGCAALLGAADDGGRWVHPVCRPLAVDRNGPFTVLPDGRLLTVDDQGLRSSTDDGVTWSAAQPVCPGINPKEPASCRLVQTAGGALVLVYLNFTAYTFSWDDQAGEPRDTCRLEVWAIRSTDGGATWTDHQRLLDGYNANFFGFVQTRAGRLVVVLEHLVRNPGHWVSCSFSSDNDGQTWTRSNLIDLGGHGHHDGATEPTVVELADGRLFMSIRTNLDRFWQAFSDDGGRYWRTIQPGPLDASSAPGAMVRLQSGRLVLVWNRLNPSDGRVHAKAKPGPACEGPASWFREELSVAVSEDDGRTWSTPFVLARQPGGQLSYPFVVERRPGELWVIAGFAFRSGWKEPLPLRLGLSEADLLREAAAARR